MLLKMMIHILVGWDPEANVCCVLTNYRIVFRPKLDRRLTALEKKLKVEPADRHTSEWNLQPLVLVSFEGVRVRHRAASLKLDRAGRNINDSAKSKVSITQAGDITKFLSPKKPGVTKVDATPVSIKAEVSSRILDEKPNIDLFLGKGTERGERKVHLGWTR